MIGSLNRVLRQIFATSFYKTNAGTLLAIFLGGGAYLFFIGVLNQTHFTPQEILRFKFIFVLTLINSPYIAGLVAIAWTLYTAKSWKHITTQLALPEHEFLLYTATTIDLKKQRVSWCVTQTIIMLPIIAFDIFVLIIAIIFQASLIIPLALLAFTLLLIILSACRHTHQINSLNREIKTDWLARLTHAWPKPYPSWFIYHLIHENKPAFIITKLVSAALIIVGTHLFVDDALDHRTTSFLILSMAITHSILSYRAYRFESRYLTFVRNLPYSKAQRYGQLIIGYGILTIPESLWVIIKHPLQAPVLILINISTGLLLRSVVYRSGPDMQKFIRYTFLALILGFTAILYQTQIPLVMINLTLSGIVYYRRYDHQDKFNHFIA